MPSSKISTPITVKQYTLPPVGSSAIATTAPTLSAYGFTSTQASSLVSTVNALVSEVTDCKQVIATLLDELAKRGVIA